MNNIQKNKIRRLVRQCLREKEGRPLWITKAMGMTEILVILGEPDFAEELMQIIRTSIR